MRILKILIVLGLVLASPAAAVVAPILLTPEAIDTASFAKPRIARVTHVDLDLTVDFTTKRLRGTATLDVLAAPGARTIVLDSGGLEIARITDGKGRALPFVVGATVTADDKGFPVTVTLNGAKQLRVDYTSAKNASALQWLDPALTAGKAHPLLFSQGEPNANRSWIPTQDSPGIRQTWDARITVPTGMTAVMSAEMADRAGVAVPGGRQFTFHEPNPVPPYLIALGVGNLVHRDLGKRTGVWTEPAMVDRAAAELVDIGKLVDAAEGLYGPYRWGRYDVLVLPPSFPFGGMENPRLTFLTPTFITGDRSQISLVAHELAHSWSGNLVTNATWSDSWLNEGFTTYFENRIMEAVFGRARAEVEADLYWDELQKGIADAAKDPSVTRLHGAPFASTLDYVKGSDFLFTLEKEVGRPRLDAWLRGYFDRHAFQPQTTAGLLVDLRANLVKGDAALEKRLDLDAWAYAPGLPANAVHIVSPRLEAVDAASTAFAGGAVAGSLKTAEWSTQEWLRFLQRLPRQESKSRLDDLDGTFKLSASHNAEIRFAWLMLAVGNRYDAALPALEDHLTSIGRWKMVAPLYRALNAQGAWGQPVATRIYARARSSYHPFVVASVDRLMASKTPSS
ncbi:M1 family metallopeptidase [Sphingosinicellaceae bacterium]|nr:M1 family metallopeptidase [Sphingosinicellaceae bacterium]